MPLLWRQLRAITRHALLTPFIRVLLVSVILWLTAFTYCKYRFWRDPHSAFFKSDHVYDLHYTLQRKTEAMRLVETTNSTTRNGALGLLKAGKDPIICAAFVTVARDNIQYLDQSIGSMLEGLYPEERSALYLEVFFADTTVSKHPDWQAAWVHRLADSLDTYDISEEDMRRVKEAELQRNFYLKGIFDYLQVLERCMNRTSAPFIAIFEDDLIFAEGWMTRTLNALAELKHRGDPSMSHVVVSSDRWLYLRLFYTETSLSWQNTDFWYRNMPLTFVLASSLSAGLLFFINRMVASSKDYLDNLSIAVVSLITVPAFLALIFMIGKYSLHPLDGVVQMNRYGCCTQAMVFPRSEIQPLIQYLKERNHGQTDSLIEEYSDRDGLDRYALSPQVVQHTGLVSSRDNTFVNTQSNWAFWFETNRPEVLKRAHQKEVKNVPWKDLRS